MSESNISMHPAFGFEPPSESVAQLDDAGESRGTRGVWQARAALGELLVLSFSPPSRPLTITVAQGEYVRAACAIARDLERELPAPFAEELAQYEEMADTALLEKLEKEYARLFGNGEEGALLASSGALSCYESDWRNDAATFTETIEADVAEAYRACGLMAKSHLGDPLDHLEAEIEFLEFVALAHVGMVDTNPEAPVGAEGYGAAFTNFMDTHAGKWMPPFADAVIAQTELPFYRSAARLLKVFANL